MVLKRTSLHLDPKDLHALERLAKRESTQTGSRVTAALIVRRLIRQHLRQQRGEA